MIASDSVQIESLFGRLVDMLSMLIGMTHTHTHHRSMITDRIYVSFFCFDLIPTGVHGRTTGIRIYGRRIYADKNVEYECATAS